MPYYDYKCTSCEKEWEADYLIADRNIPLSLPCPFCKQKDTVVKELISAPPLGDPVKLGIRKPPAVFRSRIKEIMKKNPNSKQQRKHGHNLTEI